MIQLELQVIQSYTSTSFIDFYGAYIYRSLLHELFGSLVPNGGNSDHPPNQVVSEGVHAPPDCLQQVPLQVADSHRKDRLGWHLNTVDVFDGGGATQALSKHTDKYLFSYRLRWPFIYLYII